MTTIVGIDPGLSGAVAIFQPELGELEVLDIPTLEVKRGASTKRVISEIELAQLLEPHAGAVAYLERVSARPGQGVTSMFNFGMTNGLIRGMLAAYSFRTTLITPQEWRRKMRVADGKDGSRQRAMELFPACAGLFKRKKDDGRAEAALIAMAGFLYSNPNKEAGSKDHFF